MSTRSSARNLFPPFDNLELTIQRRSRANPTLLNDFEMDVEGNGDPPIPDLRTMKELCQPSLNGRGGPIARITIQAMNFGLKNDIIQQVQNSCQFHGLLGNDANKHLDKFLHVTQSIKVNGVTDDALRLYLFPHSLTHHATACSEMKSPTSVNVPMNHTFYNGLTLRHRDTTNAAAGGTFMKRRPEECYDLIENMTAHHNDWDTSAQRTTVGQNQNDMLREPIKVILTNLKGNNQGRNQFFQGASHGLNPSPAYQAPAYQAPGYQASVHQPSIPQPQVVTTNEFTNYMKANDAILKNMQTNMTSLTNSNLKLKNMFGQFIKMNTASSLGSGTLPSNTITNPKEDLKVERKTEVTKDTVHATNNGCTKDIQPSVVQVEIPIQNSKPVLAPIIEPVVAPVSASKPNLKPSIPYPSRLRDQKLHDKANDQKEKFFQIFKDLDFNISFADALILMPKFGPTIKTVELKRILNS
uniref:Reverse transcriptase domain-containing protein n=1 Tax=Tanacetum cinerariifolium TaxID=118510 RepID=A0A699IF26_TANCI|nr:reverse transcriptase domain-containing protein [Tanacetum cinerariifolium]